MPAVKRPGPTKGQNPNAKRQGTAPRTVMPAPTPPKPAAPEPAPAESEEAASKAVLDFAKQSVGTKVGSGECYDLADHALKASGAKNAADHGKITTDGDYVWGREVPLGDVKPGDVIQFRDYKFDKRTDKTDGSWNSENGKRPHHTAVVESINDQGVAVVIEQNVGEKRTPI